MAAIWIGVRGPPAGHNYANASNGTRILLSDGRRPGGHARETVADDGRAPPPTMTWRQSTARRWMELCATPAVIRCVVEALVHPCRNKGTPPAHCPIVTFWESLPAAVAATARSDGGWPVFLPFWYRCMAFSELMPPDSLKGEGGVLEEKTG